MSLGTYTMANGRVYDLVELVKAEGDRRFDSYLVRSRDEPHYEGWIALSWVVRPLGPARFVLLGADAGVDWSGQWEWCGEAVP